MNDDLYETFPELAELDRRNRHAIDERARQLQSEFGQRFENVERERNHQRCIDALDADPTLRDKWRQTNNSQDFMNWLSRVDELSGERLQYILTRAYNVGYTEQVLNIFRSYLTEKTPEHQRAPGAHQSFGGAAPAVRDERRKMWRREDISAFYRDCRRGLYDKRPVERARIEAEILAAARQGRVLNPPVRMPGEK